MNITIACLLFLFAAHAIGAAKLSIKKKYKLRILRITGDANAAKYAPGCKVDFQNTEDGFVILNGTLRLAMDTPNDALTNVYGYQKNLDGKSWQTLPSLVFNYKMCEMLMTDETFIVPPLIKGSNLKRQCPIKKGEYVLSNVKVGEGWPPTMNGDYWLFVFDVTMDKGFKYKVEAEVLFDKRAEAPPQKPEIPAMG